MANQRGFTLVELLVVIAIIGLLATVVLASLNNARDKARAAQSALQIKELATAVSIYIIDTNIIPECRLDCTSTTDPLRNNLGVANWYGPYFPRDLSSFTHPWGGHLGVGAWDYNGDGIPEPYVIFDDDAPGTSSFDNSGRIPDSLLEEIDAILDDGNLTTGQVMGGLDGPSFTAEGELVYIITAN